MNTSFFKNNHWSIIISALIAALLIIFIIFPSWQAISRMANDSKTLRRQLEQAKQTKSLNETLTAYNSYRQKLPNLNHALLTKNRELEFITALEEVAAKNNISQTISLGEYTAIPETTFFTMPVQIAVEGSFNNINSYLRDIEKLPFYVIMENITITKQKKSGDEAPVTNGFLIATTFWQ